MTREENTAKLATLRSETDQLVKDYNEAIKLAAEVGDNATRDILKDILMDEDKHVDELEELQDQMDQMSLQIFLSTQL